MNLDPRPSPRTRQPRYVLCLRWNGPAPVSVLTFSPASRYNRRGPSKTNRRGFLGRASGIAEALGIDAHASAAPIAIFPALHSPSLGGLNVVIACNRRNPIRIGAL